MAETASRDWLSLLRKSGKRITPERELLARVIEQNAHLDAEQIYRIAQTERPHIGLATVYRTLTLLKELGVIQSTDLGENHDHFELRAEEHVHLVCVKCGRVVDVPAPRALWAAARDQCFEIERTSLEVFGRCAACRRDAAHGE